MISVNLYTTKTYRPGSQINFSEHGEVRVVELISDHYYRNRFVISLFVVPPKSRMVARLGINQLLYGSYNVRRRRFYVNEVTGVFLSLDGNVIPETFNYLSRLSVIKTLFRI